MLQCKDCGVQLTEDNTYKRAGRKAHFPTGYYRKCKGCYNKDRGSRVNENRQWIIEQMGGKCCRCGYNKCDAALDLHHLDPTTKDEQTMKNLRHITDKERVQSELDKCILLCANCHREEHAKDR